MKLCWTVKSGSWHLGHRLDGNQFLQDHDSFTYWLDRRTKLVVAVGRGGHQAPLIATRTRLNLRQTRLREILRRHNLLCTRQGLPPAELHGDACPRNRRQTLFVFVDCCPQFDHFTRTVDIPVRIENNRQALGDKESTLPYSPKLIDEFPL